MKNAGYVEINIKGKIDNEDLAPDNYDIKDVIFILQNTENLLFPNGKKDRPIITYSIEKGSVRHILKTTIATIIKLNAIIGEINKSNSIDFLDLKSAQAIENIQNIAYKTKFDFIIQTSIENSNNISIGYNTKFLRRQSIWGDAEFYLYGEITKAGGQTDGSISLDTQNLGIVNIKTPINFLKEYENNLLYKILGIRASGKQNSETGEIDKKAFSFIELVEYSTSLDENYLNSLRDKAKHWVDKINEEEWLNEIRGGYDI